MIARSSQDRSTERRDGVSIAEVVIDVMAIGNPVPCGPADALEPHPRHPYSADMFPSNWELWRNFPDAMQQWCGLFGSVGPNRLLPPGTTAAIAGWRGAQYDGIVAFAACGYFERSPGVRLMMVVMLVAGIGCLLAGLLAIGFGIPVKEFSFGNTLILAGAVAACTGFVLLGLWAVVRELKNICLLYTSDAADE